MTPQYPQAGEHNLTVERSHFTPDSRPDSSHSLSSGHQPSGLSSHPRPGRTCLQKPGQHFQPLSTAHSIITAPKTGGGMVKGNAMEDPALSNSVVDFPAGKLTKKLGKALAG